MQVKGISRKGVTKLWIWGLCQGTVAMPCKWTTKLW